MSEINRSQASKDMTAPGGAAEPGKRWYGALGYALVAYLLTLPVVVLGVEFGARLLGPAARPKCPRHIPPAGDVILDTLTLWDSQWYLEIATRGYTYHPQGHSAVAFFPAYPVLVRALLAVAPLSLQWAGLAVSHIALVGAYGLFWAYTRLRLEGHNARAAHYALAALALFPTSLFMRMAYTESLFLLLCMAAFWGMERRWPLGLVAALVGLATATRSVGVAMLLPLALHVREQSTSWRETAMRLGWLLPLAVWGLAAYMAYQAWAFGEPLAFAKTQTYWRMRPGVSWEQTLLALGSWEPIWSVYVPGVPGYWGDLEPGLPVVLSYQSGNVVWWLGAWVLVGVGWVKGWLTRREAAVAVLLLGIPYVLAGYRFCMMSQGRYVSVVFPIYLVLGQLLCRLPRAAAIGVLGVFGAYLAWFSAMLAAGYLVI